MSTPTNKPSLLIVDDDPLIADALTYFLSQYFTVSTAHSRPEAIDHLRQGFVPDAALVDLGLPPHPHRPDEGYKLISDLLAHAESIRIVVLSGQNEAAHARHARALGAVEFVAKPADPDQLSALLLQIVDLGNLSNATSPDQQAALIGDSLPMQKLKALIRQYADSPFPVLIEGESGSGKELVAEQLHQQSNRTQHPFLALNCAAISPNLVEPTLFGHNKGAFTGATQTRPGYFEDAADGTLFLDEIGELPLELQPKLLRVLENGEYQRVGDTQPRRARARIVAATNRDLRREVREGRFRADLYHRLSVFTINVPSVRETGTDRQQLLDHYRRFYAKQVGQAPFTLEPAAQALWAQYPFPGNVRELRNIVIRLTTKHPATAVTASELGEEFDALFAPTGEIEPPKPADPGSFSADSMAEVARQTLENGSINLDEVLGNWERAYILAAQTLAHGNMSQTAKLLGINRTTLYNRIDTLDRNKTKE